jgi:hypothetical protein
MGRGFLLRLAPEPKHHSLRSIHRQRAANPPARHPHGSLLKLRSHRAELSFWGNQRPEPTPSGSINSKCWTASSFRPCWKAPVSEHAGRGYSLACRRSRRVGQALNCYHSVSQLLPGRLCRGFCWSNQPVNSGCFRDGLASSHATPSGPLSPGPLSWRALF